MIINSPFPKESLRENPSLPTGRQVLRREGLLKKLTQRIALAPSLFKRSGCPKDSFGGDEFLDLANDFIRALRMTSVNFKYDSFFKRL